MGLVPAGGAGEGKLREGKSAFVRMVAVSLGPKGRLQVGMGGRCITGQRPGLQPVCSCEMWAERRKALEQAISGVGEHLEEKAGMGAAGPRTRLSHGSSRGLVSPAAGMAWEPQPHLQSLSWPFSGPLASLCCSPGAFSALGAPRPGWHNSWGRQRGSPPPPHTQSHPVGVRGRRVLRPGMPHQLHVLAVMGAGAGLSEGPQVKNSLALMARSPTPASTQHLLGTPPACAQGAPRIVRTPPRMSTCLSLGCLFSWSQVAASFCLSIHSSAHPSTHQASHAVNTSSALSVLWGCVWRGAGHWEGGPQPCAVTSATEEESKPPEGSGSGDPTWSRVGAHVKGRRARMPASPTDGGRTQREAPTYSFHTHLLGTYWAPHVETEAGECHSVHGGPAITRWAANKHPTKGRGGGCRRSRPRWGGRVPGGGETLEAGAAGRRTGFSPPCPVAATGRRSGGGLRGGAADDVVGPAFPTPHALPPDHTACGRSSPQSLQESLRPTL